MVIFTNILIGGLLIVQSYFLPKIKERKVRTMVYTISRFKFWRNLQGDFIYRVHPRLRKAINIMISVVLGALVLAGLYLPQAIIKENYDEMEKHDM
jgi:hypothetical protein